METYALYARTRTGDEWVMCWNFNDLETAKNFAMSRSDVGTINLFKQIWINNELKTEEKLETFVH